MIALYDNLIFTSAVHNRNTGQNNSNVLRLPDYRNEFTRKNVFYEGIKLFNELRQEIKDSTSTQVFKNKCKKYVMQNYEII